MRQAASEASHGMSGIHAGLTWSADVILERLLDLNPNRAAAAGG